MEETTKNSMNNGQAISKAKKPVSLFLSVSIISVITK